METQNNALLDMIGFGAFALLAAIAWFFVYVQPADERRYEIMACMGSEISQASYDACVEELYASK